MLGLHLVFFWRLYWVVVLKVISFWSAFWREWATMLMINDDDDLSTRSRRRSLIHDIEYVCLNKYLKGIINPFLHSMHNQITTGNWWLFVMMKDWFTIFTVYWCLIIIRTKQVYAIVHYRYLFYFRNPILLQKLGKWDWGRIVGKIPNSRIPNSTRINKLNKETQRS